MVLHATHLVLACVALYSFVSNEIFAVKRAPLAAIWPVLPWCLLTLLLWMPGVYLEFPSDPWEHLSRTTRWAALNVVTDHEYWQKAGYFFNYSFLRIFASGSFLWCLNLLQTLLGLLLAWSYYRLGVQSSLKPAFSFVFAAMLALSLGNDVFSFVRYYGPSGSILAQVAATSLLRLGLELAQGTLTGISATNHRWPFAAGSGFLVLLMAFTHPQSLGIALLGLVGVVVWRLLAWRRSTVWWLLALFVFTGWIAVRWFPRDLALDSTYVPAGWLAPWYGFDLLHPQAPAFHRALLIVGGVGLVSILAGIYLAASNHIAAWLTLMPLVVLVWPVFTIPFANYLAQRGSVINEIMGFHRMLFAIPIGLSIVVVAQRLNDGRQLIAAALGVGALLLLLLSSPSRPFYSRLWHSLAQTPADLSLQHLFEKDLLGLSWARAEQPAVLTSPGIAFAVRALGHPTQTEPDRLILYPPPSPPSASLNELGTRLRSESTGVPSSPMVFPAATKLVTPGSLSGVLSGHWLAQEVALQHAGGQEMAAVRGELTPLAASHVDH